MRESIELSTKKCTFGDLQKCWECHEMEPNVKEGDIVTKYNYQFEWTHQHIKPNQLNEWRYLSDPIVDNILLSIGLKNQNIIEEIVARGEKGDTMCQEFLESVCNFPYWVDREKLKRGQEFFKKNCLPMTMVLLFVSLLSEFSAPKINKVLYSTGYLSKKTGLVRIFETYKMVESCMESLEVMKGSGWQSVIQVRFVHGHVRQRLRKFTKWNEQEYGVPINQEDMVYTLLSFQIVVLIGLSFLNVPFTSQEAEDYTHLWRYIGYLIGVKEELNPCTSVSRSEVVFHSILMHIVQVEESSGKLLDQVIEGISDGTILSKRLLQEITRDYMGERLSDEMKLPKSDMFVCRLFVIVWNFFIVLSSYSSYLPLIGGFVAYVNMSVLYYLTRSMIGYNHQSFNVKHPPKEENI